MRLEEVDFVQRPVVIRTTQQGEEHQQQRTRCQEEPQETQDWSWRRMRLVCRGT